MRHNHTVIHHGEVVTVIFTDIFSSKKHEIEVPLHDYNKWINGAHVQVAFPYLDRDMREIFITGIGPDSWAKHITKEEE